MYMFFYLVPCICIVSSAVWYPLCFSLPRNTLCLLFAPSLLAFLFKLIFVVVFSCFFPSLAICFFLLSKYIIFLLSCLFIALICLYSFSQSTVTIDISFMSNIIKCSLLNIVLFWIRTLSLSHMETRHSCTAINYSYIEKLQDVILNDLVS